MSASLSVGPAGITSREALTLRVESVERAASSSAALSHLSGLALVTALLQGAWTQVHMLELSLPDV